MLLIETVPVVTIVPTVWGGEVVGGGVASVVRDAAERKHITLHQDTMRHS